MMSRYSIRDAIAWDAAMLIEEARLAQTLGWMEEDEVWGVVFLNPQRVQGTFESWRNFRILSGSDFAD